MMDWDGTGWVELLSKEDLAADVWDGKWHCFQFQFDLANRTVRFWLDGTLRKTLTDYGDTGATWGAEDPALQHVPMGNVDAVSWGTTWAAMEMDDLVIATTKAETDPDEEEPATTTTLSGTTLSGGRMIGP